MLPFTHKRFVFVFAVYNGAVCPAQLVAYLIAAVAVALLVLRPSRLADRFIGAGLAAMWAWTGVAYHMCYPGVPTFGITPCPVTLFTFGLLLLTTAPVPRWLLAIPFAWALVGGSASFLLGVPQDWLLLASSGAAVLILLRDRGRAPPAPGLRAAWNARQE